MFLHDKPDFWVLYADLRMKLHVGDRLNSIRTKQGKTQEQMGEILSLSQSAYSRLENNETLASLEDLMRYAKLLKVPAQDLLPEILTIHNNPTENASGIVLGNDFTVAPIYTQVYNNNHFYSADETAKALQKQIADLQEELNKSKAKTSQ